jgi:hypothetical protein
MRKVFLRDVLSQTRGAGKPPPVCIVQAKIAFLKTVTTPDDISVVKLKIIAQCMDEALRELPSHIFTGLSTKSGVTVNNSACFEYTQEDGATIQAIQDICKGFDYGLPVEKSTWKPENRMFSSTLRILIRERTFSGVVSGKRYV